MSFLMHATSILIIVVRICNSGHHDRPDTKWQKRATDTYSKIYGPPLNNNIKYLTGVDISIIDL